jgi:hypothetical protein
MNTASQLPTWMAYAVAFGTPLLAFLGAMSGHLVTRRGARELETRSRREQLMETLQWAAELAISDDEAKARLGLLELHALSDSELSNPEIQTFVDAALEAVVAGVADEVEDHPDAEIEPQENARDSGITVTAGGATTRPAPIESGHVPEEGGGRQ